mgnify:CR=1 FL=1
MTTYTDNQLKAALAKLLPEIVERTSQSQVSDPMLWWIDEAQYVLDTELLHLCWLVEETLPKPDSEEGDTDQVYINHLGFTDYCDCYHKLFADICHASWQQRVRALCKVKGVAIV